MKSTILVFYFVIVTVLFSTAQNPFLLKDINPGSDDGVSADLDGAISSFDNKLYFIGYKTQGFSDKPSIWSTDGTSENTNLIFTDDDISFSLFSGNRVLSAQNSIMIHNNRDILYSYDGTELKTLFDLENEDETFNYIYPYDDGAFVFYSTNSNISTPLYYADREGIKTFLGVYEDISHSHHVISTTNNLWLCSSDNNPGSHRTVVSDKDSLGTMYLEDFLRTNDYGDYFDIESAFGIEDRLYITYRNAVGASLQAYVIDMVTKQRKSINVCCDFKAVLSIGNYDIIQTLNDLYAYDRSTFQLTKISDKIGFYSKIYEHKDKVYFVESPNSLSNRYTIMQTDGTSSGTEELISENTFDDELDLISVGEDIVVRMKDEMNDYYLNHINLSTREVSNMIGEKLVFGYEFFGIVNETFVFTKNTAQLGTELYYSDFPLDVDEDGFLSSVDCNDQDPNINPDALEICNGVDDNCDGTIDEGFSLTDYYMDTDGDGYGDANSVLSSCFQPTGAVLNSNDCNDDDPSVYPGATEICNDIDDNCDGNIDEGFTTANYYLDADGDGFGDGNNVINDCMQPTGTVTNDEDCNDDDDSIYPGATELCNDVDDNCDGSVDEGLPQETYYADSDNDGYGNPDDSITDCTAPADYVTNADDCNDSDAGINPDGEDIPNNGIDEDCDGMDAVSNTLNLGDASIKVYPNPSNGFIHISSTSADQLHTTLLDIHGKQLLSSTATLIDLNNYPNGVYFLRLTDEQNKSSLVRIILSK